jgi:hypothetical protein
LELTLCFGFEDEGVAEDPIAGELRELALALLVTAAAALREAFGAMAQTDAGADNSEATGAVGGRRRLLMLFSFDIRRKGSAREAHIRKHLS